jgi:hypothetical protein
LHETKTAGLKRPPYFFAAGGRRCGPEEKRDSLVLSAPQYSSQSYFWQQDISQRLEVAMQHRQL